MCIDFDMYVYVLVDSVIVIYIYIGIGLSFVEVSRIYIELCEWCVGKVGSCSIIGI